MKKYLKAGIMFFLAISLLGCGGLSTMIESFDWPTQRPAESDLIGEWHVSAQSIDYAKEKFEINYEGSSLILNEDHTFIFYNFQDCSFDIECDLIKQLEGEWNVKPWGAYFEVELLPKDFRLYNIQVFLWNTQAPYRLWLGLGDLDNGQYIFYDKI